MTAPARLATVYTDDEEILIRAGGDFDILAPDTQMLARGVDGSFGPDPWTFTSASVDFQSAGVGSGHVCKLVGPDIAKLGPDWFAVDSASGHSLVLRRPGMDLGVGQPYVTGGGVSGVAFAVKTLAPQIEDVSFAINRTYAIDPNIAYRVPGLVYDLDESNRPRDLRQLCVLMVMVRRLQVNLHQGGDFQLKLEKAEAELDALLDTVQVRWGTRGTDEVPVGRFSTRIAR